MIPIFRLSFQRFHPPRFFYFFSWDDPFSHYRIEWRSIPTYCSPFGGGEWWWWTWNHFCRRVSFETVPTINFNRTIIHISSCIINVVASNTAREGRRERTRGKRNRGGKRDDNKEEKRRGMKEGCVFVYIDIFFFFSMTKEKKFDFFIKLFLIWIFFFLCSIKINNTQPGCTWNFCDSLLRFSLFFKQNRKTKIENETII